MPYDKDQSVPSNVSLAPVLGAIGPVPQGKAICFNVYNSGQQKHCTSKEAFTVDEAENWRQFMANTRVGEKGALGITNLSSTTRRREKNFAWTHRMYFDCDDGGTHERLAALLSQAGLRFSIHESSGSVKRRTLDPRLRNTLPSKWHVEIVLSKPLFNPLDELYPQGETEEQQLAREAAETEEEAHKRRARDGYLRGEWKRKYRFVARFLSRLAGLDGADGSCGFDLTTSQMCQLRFLGIKFSEDGPAPYVWSSGGSNSLDWEKFLELAGYKPEPYEPYVPPSKEISIPTSKGVVTYERSGGMNELDDEIRRRISLESYMGRLGQGHTTVNYDRGSMSWYCPVPTHPNPDSRTLETYPSNVHAGDRWICRGDCVDKSLKSKGDVIDLEWLCRGHASRHAARLSLAVELGLNPDDYREKLTQKYEEVEDFPITIVFKLPDPVDPNGPTATLPSIDSPSWAPAPEPSTPPPLQLPAPVQPPLSAAKKFLANARKTPPKTAPPGLEHTAKWAKNYAFRSGDLKVFTRAMTKVLMEAGAVLRKNKKGEWEHRMDILASTLWQGVHEHYRTYDELLKDIAITYDRIEKGGHCVGRTRLRSLLGTQAMFEFSKALRRDGCDFKESLKKLVGFGLTRGDDKDWLDGLAKWIETHPVEKDEDPEELAKWIKRYTRFMNAIRRPGACSLCEQIAKGERGRDLGPSRPDGTATPLKQRLVCTSKTCTYCYMQRTLYEMELLEDLWKDRPSKDEDGIFVITVTGIEKLDHIGVIKKEVSKDPDPKLGILGWGDDGKATLSYFVTTVEAEIVVRSAVIGGSYMACGKMLEINSSKVKTVGEAIDTAIEAKLSFHVHARQLIEERRNDDLCEWLWWAVYKTPVKNPKNSLALPWPTQLQIKERIKEKCGNDFVPDIYPGEKIYYELYHRATGYFLGKRTKHPWTLDQAMDAMAINHGLRETLAAGGAALSA